MIDTVTLDAAGTLITVAEPVARTYADLARRHGGDLSVEKLAEGFRRVFPAMPPMAFTASDEDELAHAERRWWKDLVQQVVSGAGDVRDFDGYFDDLFAHYASAAAWRAYPEVPDVLGSLRRRGLRTAVVSNFDSRLEPILAGLGIEPLVDLVVYSTRCGAAKPHRRIFHHTLAALGAEPHTALHVGDNPIADYHGALSAGMTALLLDREPAARSPDIACITDLTEIDPYLDQP
jgi:putative hydrolase of the HAD superfamily